MRFEEISELNGPAGWRELLAQLRNVEAQLEIDLASPHPHLSIRQALELVGEDDGTGVAMPIGVTALCSKPESLSDTSCATMRIEYCFLPMAFFPSILRTRSVSFSLFSLAPAYCSTMHTYLTRPAAWAAFRRQLRVLHDHALAQLSNGLGAQHITPPLERLLIVVVRTRQKCAELSPSASHSFCNRAWIGETVCSTWQAAISLASSGGGSVAGTVPTVTPEDDGFFTGVADAAALAAGCFSFFSVFSCFSFGTLFGLPLIMRLMSNDIFWPLGASDVCVGNRNLHRGRFSCGCAWQRRQLLVECKQSKAIVRSRLGALCIAITGSSDRLRDAFGDSSTA